jgi:hypothetical protein
VTVLDDGFGVGVASATVEVSNGAGGPFPNRDHRSVAARTTGSRVGESVFDSTHPLG